MAMRRFEPLRAVLSIFGASHGRMLLAGATLSLATALAGIALLGLSGWFISATALAGATLATALAFDVFMPSAGIRLLALGRTGARYGERLVTHDATLKVLAGLRERLFRGWSAPEAAGLLALRPSRLLFRLTMDVDALDTLYLRAMVPAFAAIGSGVAAVIALCFVDLQLAAAVGVALAGLGLGIPSIAARQALDPSRRRALAMEAMRARVIDMAKGQADLLMTGRLGAQVASIRDAEKRLARADDALDRVGANAAFGIGVLGSALLAGTLLSVAHLAADQAIGVPAAVFALLIVLASVEPFAAVRRGAVEFGRSVLAARRLAPRLKVNPSQDGKALRAPARQGTAVAFRDVCLRRGDAALPVLADLSLDIAAGERVAVIGASGAGKSTLLSLIAGEIAPSRGTVESLPAALLTQRTELFRDTLRGNLTLARTEAADVDLTEALSAAGLGAHLAALPRGLSTALGEGGLGLSAGEARRLALARLLLRDAPVWLLDEPTEGVDGATARDLVARLRERCTGRTVVIATHLRREAELADRLIHLGRDGVEDHRRGTAGYARLLDFLRSDAGDGEAAHRRDGSGADGHDKGDTSWN